VTVLKNPKRSAVIAVPKKESLAVIHANQLQMDAVAQSQLLRNDYVLRMGEFIMCNQKDVMMNVTTA